MLGPAFLFLLWDDAVPRQAAKLGFAWGAGLFLAGTWWIYTAVHDFGGAPAWMAALMLLVPVAVMGSYYALLGWVATRVGRRPRLLHCLLLLPAGWTLIEWLRGWLLSGFPWLQLGYAHSDSPLAALAPIGGIHLVGLANAVCAGALLVLLRGSWRERGVALAVIVAIWGGSLELSHRGNGRRPWAGRSASRCCRARSRRTRSGRSDHRKDDARPLPRAQSPGAGPAADRLAGIRAADAGARG